MREVLPATSSWIALAAAMAAGACGGNVVIDAGGAGGAATTTDASSSVSSGSGGDPESPCASVCDFFEANCGESSSCQQSCVDLFNQRPECSEGLSAYLECLRGNLTSCDIPMACVAQSEAVNACLSGESCSVVECSSPGSQGECTCKGSCQGLDLGVECSAGADGLTCNCFVGGNLVAACFESGALACSFQDGCCAPYFGLSR